MNERPNTLALAHRIAWRYKKSSDPAHSDTYTFNEATLLQFAAAVAAIPAPEGAPTLLAALGQASFCLRELLPDDPDAKLTVSMIEAALAAQNLPAPAAIRLTKRDPAECPDGHAEWIVWVDGRPVSAITTRADQTAKVASANPQPHLDLRDDVIETLRAELAQERALCDERGRKLYGDAAQSPAEGDVPADLRFSWMDFQQISELPVVDEAIRNLLDDQTEDNATCMIREIVEAAGDRLFALTAQPQPKGTGVMQRIAMDLAVSRFLGWPLPKTFSPDCGISFDGRKDDQWNKNKTWPIGTNLFTVDEARAMLEHVLGGVQAPAVPSPAPGEPVAWRDDGKSAHNGPGRPAYRVITAETKATMPESVAAAYSEPLYPLGAQAPAVTPDDAKDAARYRKWRGAHLAGMSGAAQFCGSAVIDMLYALGEASSTEQVDSAIDAALGSDVPVQGPQS